MKSTEKESKEKVELKLYYYKEDRYRVLAYWSNIQKHIDKGDKIPAKVLKKWFSFFDKPMLDEHREIQLIIQKANIALDPKLLAKYDFTIKAKGGQVKTLSISDMMRFEASQDRSVTVSLAMFLTAFFEDLGKDKTFFNIISDKHKFIEKAYLQLRSYLKIVPQKKQPTFYVQSIIIGYLAAAFELVLDEKTYRKSPSFGRHYSEYLHNQTSYICKKIKAKDI